MNSGSITKSKVDKRKLPTPIMAKNLKSKKLSLDKFKKFLINYLRWWKIYALNTEHREEDK